MPDICFELPIANDEDGTLLHWVKHVHGQSYDPELGDLVNVTETMETTVLGKRISLVEKPTIHVFLTSLRFYRHGGPNGKLAESLKSAGWILKN